MDLLKKDVNITNLSNFKTKAFTKYYYEINNIDDVLNLDKVIDFKEKNSLKILFVGDGTNLLFAFDVFDGIVIKNNLKGFNYKKETKILKSYSGELISDISKVLEKNFNQKLWHRFIGLPGSIGGAVFGNAGCFGLEVQNNFKKAEVYNLEKKEIEILDKKNLNFSYRNSFIKENIGKYFVVKVFFDLNELIEKYPSDIDNIKFRKSIQPRGNSAGSFFKNPSKEHSAGKLIEEVGLKGFTYKDAYFSDKHANFLMTNKDGGDFKDLIYLINLAKEKVFKQFGLKLKEEARIIH